MTIHRRKKSIFIFLSKDQSSLLWKEFFHWCGILFLFKGVIYFTSIQKKKNCHQWSEHNHNIKAHSFGYWANFGNCDIFFGWKKAFEMFRKVLKKGFKEKHLSFEPSSFLSLLEIPSKFSFLFIIFTNFFPNFFYPLKNGKV